jgi:hypothetical protein
MRILPLLGLLESGKLSQVGKREGDPHGLVLLESLREEAERKIILCVAC